MEVAIVIPVYKTRLSQNEHLALQQCLKVLGIHVIILAHPEGLDCSIYNKFNVLFEPFEASYFKNIGGYNKLMLTSEFYERFLNYKFILIYQLDAFVFKDELLHWCKKDYDYIGAPWLATDTFFSRLMMPFKSKKIKQRSPIFFEVGNGGLSLRKTKIFFKISKEIKKTIQDQLRNSKEIYSIEDVFWSLKVPEYYPDFSIPHYKEAAAFAIDRKPKIGLSLIEDNLPFACHGFDKPKVINFWKPIIEKETQKLNQDD